MRAASKRWSARRPITDAPRNTSCATGDSVSTRGEHDLAQRLGEGVAVGIVGGKELLGEERVAIGAGVGAIDELGRRIAADDRGDELTQLVAIEARELHAFDDPGSVELGERRSQRVPPVQVVGAIGPEQHDPSRAQAARQIHEEVARRPVGPMQVFENDQRRNPIAEAFEHAEQLLEQRGRAELRILGRGDAVQLGDERREIVARRTDDGLEGDVVEFAVKRAQRLDDRTERERAIDDLDAAPADHERRLGEPAFEFGDEARLADAGLAGEEHSRRHLVGDHGLPERFEPGQLGVTTDEARTRNATGHRHKLGADRGERGAK